MALNCDVQTLVDQAKCLQCIPPGMEMSALIAALCQISTTGGGSGTVTSFSAGNLSPLFTASVATATTTPALSFALSTQNANKALWGPTTGADAAPTFRSMVNADLGTTLTPQFARIGLGTAADASVPLFAEGANLGAGVTSIVGRFDCPTSNPTILCGAPGNNTGALLSYDKGNNLLFIGVYGAVGIKAKGDGTFFCDSTCEATSFIANGSPGITNTFNGSNTVSVVGGLVVGIA